MTINKKNAKIWLWVSVAYGLFFALTGKCPLWLTLTLGIYFGWQYPALTFRRKK